MTDEIDTKMAQAMAEVDKIGAVATGSQMPSQRARPRLFPADRHEPRSLAEWLRRIESRLDRIDEHLGLEP